MNAKAMIKNCGLSIDFECQQKWSSMRSIDIDPIDDFEGSINVRFCLKCRHNVHLVTNEKALNVGAKLGRCMFFVPDLDKHIRVNSKEIKQIDIDRIDFSRKTLGMLKP